MDTHQSNLFKLRLIDAVEGVFLALRTQKQDR